MSWRFLMVVLIGLVLFSCVPKACHNYPGRVSKRIEKMAIDLRGMMLKEQHYAVDRGQGFVGIEGVSFMTVYREDLTYCKETIEKLFEEENEHAETLAWAYCVIVMCANGKIGGDDLGPALDSIREIDYEDPDYEPYNSKEVDRCLLTEFGWDVEE